MRRVYDNSDTERRIHRTCPRTGLLAGCAIISLSAIASPAAFAQTTVDNAVRDAQPAAAANGIEDIIVTARKREETLISVPVAVTALSGADINRYAASDLSKIGQLAPQVLAERSGPSIIFAIRGVSSSGTDGGIASTVTVNIDGTQISRSRVAMQGFFDVQQVEVLKGPQALFFGKNSPAGVISIKSAGATDTFQGYARAGYEFKADQRYIEGAISGPISETLGFRVAGRGNFMKGWMRVDRSSPGATLPSDPLYPHPQVRHGRGPWTDEILGRVTLEWHPTDSFSAIAKVSGNRFKDEMGSNSASETLCGNRNGREIVTDLATRTPIVDVAGDCRVNGHKTASAFNPDRAATIPGYGDGEQYSKSNSIISSLNLAYTGDTLSITSITSYARLKGDWLTDTSQSAIGTTYSWVDFRSRLFSQELRASTDLDGPLNAMIGGYYENERNSSNFRTVFMYLGLDPVTGRFDNWENAYYAKGETLSAFGQINYDILSNLQVSLGARYTHERYEQDGANLYVQQQFLPTGLIKAPGEWISGEARSSNVSPDITLNWHPTERTTLYAAYKAGFKAGGFSQPALLAPQFTGDTVKFRPEKVEGVELGAKGQFFDNRLRLTAALYRYIYSDLQVQTYDPVSLSVQVSNAASARMTGAEIEAAFQPTSHLRLRGAIAYNRMRYLQYRNAPCFGGQTAAQGCGPLETGGTGQDLSGQRLHRAPKINLSGGISYDRPLTDALDIGLSIDGRYSSGFSASEVLDPRAYQDGYVLLNSSVRLYQPDEKWELALIGRNLLNKYYFTAIVPKVTAPVDQLMAQVSRPREIVLQATLRF